VAVGVKFKTKLSALAGSLLLISVQVTAAPSSEEIWDTQVAPILDRYCLKCHAGVRQKSGLDLRSIEMILRGGERGPAMIPGKPEQSRLVQFVAPDSDPHMPPEGKKQLKPEEIEVLRRWIANLPQVKSPLATASSTNIVWVPEYLVELRRSEMPRFVPPANMPASEAIDAILQADWRDRNIEPAAICDDRTFARRIYLDLAGRIPTVNELDDFLSAAIPKRREALVENLLKSADYPKHMREVFDVVLMGRPKRNNDAARRDNGWHAFLEDSFGANRPWNELVRDLILARGTNAPLRGASWYLYERRNNYQAMAEALAPVVFGVQIKCAQCHNHPIAWEIEQRHYWGLVAAFNRSKNVDTSSGIGVSESAIGGFIQFANLKKESQAATLVFLNGKTVAENRPREGEKETDHPELYLMPPKEGKPVLPAVPKFSRREALADSVTRDNPLLARAFVNRMWEILIGQGIVHPADQIDSRHRPSHPVLLEWLAKDFEEHGYDVKRLIRAIVLSRAYQFDSKPSGRTAPPVRSFARAIDKPLSAEQLLDSLLVATGNSPDEHGRVAGRALDEIRQTFLKTFPDLMPAVYNPTLEQALFWSNSPVLDDLLKPHGGNTAAQLAALPSIEARIEKAFVLVLGRPPQCDEAGRMKSLLASQPAEKGVKNLLWTLVASAEFQLNH